MVERGEINNAGMKELLSGSLGGSVFLFCGPEEYFKDYYCGAIKACTVGNDPLNYVKYTVKTDPADVASGCMGFPMFSDVKLVVMDDSGYFTGKSAPGEMVELVSDMPETCVLVFREASADKDNKLFKAIKTHGYIFKCERQSGDAIIKLLAKAARASKRSISKEAAELMVMGVGDDLKRLLSELDKLVLLTDPGEMISEAHVREVCDLSISFKTWDLTDSIANGNREKAALFLNAMLEDRVPAQRILFSIISAFLKLYDAKAFRKEGKSYQEIASLLGAHEFVAKKMCSQAANMTFERLSASIEFCLDMDSKIKNGRIDETRALELIAYGPI